MERPAIVTRIGAVGETVLARPEVGEDEITGWKVQPGDAGAMARALRECLELSPESRRQVGRRARLHVEQNFSLEQMCEKTLAIYRKLLE